MISQDALIPREQNCRPNNSGKKTRIQTYGLKAQCQPKVQKEISWLYWDLTPL